MPDHISQRPSCVPGGAWVEQTALLVEARVIAAIENAINDGAAAWDVYALPETTEPAKKAWGVIKQLVLADQEADRNKIDKLTATLSAARDLLAHHAPTVPTEKWSDTMAQCDAVLKQVGV